MNLSPLGVESSGYPSIKAVINLTTDSSNCKIIYNDPKYKDSTYSLSKPEMQRIHRMLDNTNLGHLKNKYSVIISDQPTSTIIFYTNIKKIVIEDYGLSGEYPLQELYKIVYKSKILFR
jgi:hypothetical protein